MPISDLLGQLLSGGATASDIRGELTNVVRLGLSEGQSANSMLSDLRAAEAGVRRQVFLNTVSTVRAQIAAEGAGAALNIHATPPRESINYVTSGQAGMYRHNVNLTYRSTLEPGVYSVEQTTFTVVSSELLTPAQAMGMARDIFTMHATQYDNQLIGSDYSSTTYNPR